MDILQGLLALQGSNLYLILFCAVLVFIPSREDQPPIALIGFAILVFFFLLFAICGGGTLTRELLGV
jgi:hypothetical protein